MVENSPLNRPVGGGPIRRTEVPSTQPSSETKKATEPQGGAAFQALLEKLQQQAHNLQRDSETVARPEELSGAGDRAHSSLQDALSLSDKLLEAYREAVHTDGAENTAGSDTETEADQ